MNISQQVVILSAELSELNNSVNQSRTELLNSMLQDIKLPYSESVGYWDGELEYSFVVIVKNKEDIDTLKDFAFKSFGQDAILHQDSNQMAHIINRDGSSMLAGRLEEVPANKVDKLQGYTIMNNKVYTVVNKDL